MPIAPSRALWLRHRPNKEPRESNLPTIQCCSCACQLIIWMVSYKLCWYIKTKINLKGLNDSYSHCDSFKISFIFSSIKMTIIWPPLHSLPSNKEHESIKILKRVLSRLHEKYCTEIIHISFSFIDQETKQACQTHSGDFSRIPVNYSSECLIVLQLQSVF